MNEIKKGDLVMVVRWPCCGERLGATFAVERIYDTALIGRILCFYCGAPFRDEPRAGDKTHCCPVSWLKKIDPPTTLESTDEKEELTA